MESVILSKTSSGEGIEVRVYFGERGGEGEALEPPMHFSLYYKMEWKDTLIGILKCRKRAGMAAYGELARDVRGLVVSL